MFNLKKYLFILGFYLVFPALVFAAEQVTIATYYPSPYGVYNELRLYPHAAPVTACSASTVGTMYINSSDNKLYICNGTTYTAGSSGSRNVDFDGDGKSDVAVWRPSAASYFYYILSSTGASTGTQWGALGDMPVIGDFDGDGKTDFVINRPSDNNFYISYSGGSAAVTNYGIGSDVILGGQSLWLRNGSATYYDTGNVGIGYTNPTGTAKLAVNGNVGIGITSPAYKLDVQGGDINASGYLRAGTYAMNAVPTSYGTFGLASAKNGYYGILFGQTTSNANMMFDGSGNGGLYYENGGLWAMYYIRSTNHLNINTATDLGYALGVNGDIKTTANLYLGGIRLNNASGYYIDNYSGGNDAGGMRLYRNDGNRWGYYYGDASGVGILSGAGAWAIRCTGAVNATNTGIDLYTNAALRFTIDSTGATALGTTPIYSPGDLTLSRAGGITGALFLGNSSNYGYLWYNGDNTWVQSNRTFTPASDRRVKSDIKKLNAGLKEIMQLEPKSYLFHDTAPEADHMAILPASRPAAGLVAQDVYKVIPLIVFKPKDEAKTLWGMDYHGLTAVAINAIKEQQLEIEALKKRISLLKEKLKLKLAKEAKMPSSSNTPF